MRRWIVTTLATAALGATAAPIASADWSTATVAQDAAYSVRVGVDGHGAALTVWRNWDPAIRGAWRTSDGTVQPPVTVVPPSDATGDPEVAVTTSGVGLVAWRSGAAMFVRTVAQDGTLGSVRRLSKDGTAEGRPVIDADAGGASVAWIERDAAGTRRVLVRRVRDDGAFEPAQGLVHYIGDRSLSGLGVAVNEAGAVTVVWIAAGLGVRARIRPAGSPWQGTPFLRLTHASQGEPDLVCVAVNRAGDAVVGWRITDATGATRLRHALIAGAAVAWKETIAESTSPLSEGIGPDGTIVAAHDGVLSVRPPGGPLAPPQTVEPGETDVQARMDAQGATLLTWAVSRFPSNVLSTRTRRPDGTLTPIVRVVTVPPFDVHVAWDLHPAGPAAVSWWVLGIRPSYVFQLANAVDPAPGA